MDKNKITIETYNKSAKHYQDKFWEMHLYDDTYDTFCNLIGKKNADILEVGCGPGNVTKYLLEKNPDYKILGIDSAPNMISLAEKNIPAARFKLMDCREIIKIGKSFDAIMCGFCVPYLSKEECSILILDAYSILKAKGIIYISAMEGKYRKSGFQKTSFSGEDEVYIYYYEEDFLTKQLNKSGFQIVDIKRKQYPEQDGTFSTDLIIIAKK